MTCPQPGAWWHRRSGSRARAWGVWGQETRGLWGKGLSWEGRGSLFLLSEVRAWQVLAKGSIRVTMGSWTLLPQRLVRQLCREHTRHLPNFPGDPLLLGTHRNQDQQLFLILDPGLAPEEAGFTALKLSILLFCLFRAAPAAYGGSQSRGRIRATAAGQHHSHSNAGSELHLRPTPQLTASLDP